MGNFPKVLERTLDYTLCSAEETKTPELRGFTVPASPSTLVSETPGHAFLHFALSLLNCRKWGSGQCIAGSELEEGSTSDSICFDEESTDFSYQDSSQGEEQETSLSYFF